MKLLKTIIWKAPKWAFVVGVILSSTAVFLLWWNLRGKRGAGPLAPSQEAAEVNRVLKVEFNPDELLLCGNTLLNFKGEVLADPWLEGSGNAAPPLARVLYHEGLVICCRGGQATAFSLNGRALKPITFEGMPLGPAGYSLKDSGVIFVRGGDLFHGRVNWLDSTTIANRVTDFGALRQDTFSGSWFWHGDSVFLPVLGRTHRVKLSTGAMVPDQADVGHISKGASPDGRLSVASLGIGKFAVVDFESGEAKQFSIRGNFREFLWLDQNHLIFKSNQREISLLNTADWSVVAHQAPAVILSLAVASPKGAGLVVGTNQGPMLFTCANGRFVPVSLPVEDGVWLSETAFVCVNSSSDTSIRGIWKIDATSGKERLSNRPPDTRRVSTGSAPMVAIPGGAFWIADGDLWRFDAAASTVERIPTSKKLSPELQLLE